MKTITSDVFKHPHNLAHTVKLYRDDNNQIGYDCIECGVKLEGKLTLVNDLPLHANKVDYEYGDRRLTVEVDEFANWSNRDE